MTEEQFKAEEDKFFKSLHISIEVKAKIQGLESYKKVRAECNIVKALEIANKMAIGERYPDGTVGSILPFV